MTVIEWLEDLKEYCEYLYPLIGKKELIDYIIKAVRSNTKRIKLIEQLKGDYETLSKEKQQVCEEIIEALEECNSD